MVSLHEWLTKNVEVSLPMVVNRKFWLNSDIFGTGNSRKSVFSLTLLGLTRFNNQEEVIEALRDVVIGEKGCGGFWTSAKNAQMGTSNRESNRADSSNAVLYVSIESVWQ